MKNFDLKKYLSENKLLKENINMATILSHDDYHDLYIGNRAEHDARDEEEQFSDEYMIDLDPGMYQMIYWNDDGPDHMSFDNKLDYVQKSIMNFWGEDHFIEKFGIQDEVGDDNWDYFDQHIADNLDMYYKELNNLINKSYPDKDSASGVVLLVNGKIVAGKAYKISNEDLKKSIKGDEDEDSSPGYQSWDDYIKGEKEAGNYYSHPDSPFRKDGVFGGWSQAQYDAYQENPRKYEKYLMRGGGWEI